MTNEEFYIMMIYLAVCLALAWSLYNAWVVLSLDILDNSNNQKSKAPETKSLVTNQQLEMV